MTDQTQIAQRFHHKRALGLMAVLLLTACGNGLDWDLRSGGINTREVALGATSAPPRGDANGLITYSGYQAVQASGGESVGDIAARLGLNGEELARFNALKVTDRPRMGEVLVLPTPVATAPMAGGGLDVSAIASSALDRVQTSTLAPAGTQGAPLAPAPLAPEPARHKVQRGETAFGIARQYNVSTKSLAQWNGLGPDLSVREGQYLIIPVAGAAAPAQDTAEPGAGSLTPVPPSASAPLPDEPTIPAAEAKAKADAPAADLSGNVSAASAAMFAMPVSGKIIRGYAKGKNDGIDIAAAAGTPVKAAGDGTIAAITKSTAGTPIVLIRHSGGMLTVYGGVDGLSVAKGDAVKRGQTIAKVGAGDPSFLHFEVRKGVESVDPMGYLQ